MWLCRSDGEMLPPKPIKKRQLVSPTATTAALKAVTPMVTATAPKPVSTQQVFPKTDVQIFREGVEAAQRIDRSLEERREILDKREAEVAAREKAIDIAGQSRTFIPETEMLTRVDLQKAQQEAMALNLELLKEKEMSRNLAHRLATARNVLKSVRHMPIITERLENMVQLLSSATMVEPIGMEGEIAGIGELDIIEMVHSKLAQPMSEILIYCDRFLLKQP